MKFLKYLLIGTFFGIVLTKSQVISWFRIYEMFRFESFHMYGIIGSAVVLGAIIVQGIKKSQLKDVDDKPIVLKEKDKSFVRYIAGGTLFGLGWALVGACPGPLFALLGAGYWTIIIPIAGAIAGTYLYGVLRNNLPH
jgi:uncharacterized membrane protein YedE/YeeE